MANQTMGSRAGVVSLTTVPMILHRRNSREFSQLAPPRCVGWKWDHTLFADIQVSPVPMKRILIPAILLGLCASSQAQTSTLQLQANMAFGLQGSQIVTLNGPFVPGQPLMVDLNLAGMPVTIDASPFSIRQEGFVLTVVDAAGERDVDPGDFRTMRGSVLEDPGSVVAGSVLDDGFYARISLTSGDDYWLEPLVTKIPGALPNQYVLYHNDDTIGSPGVCGADRLAHNEPKFVPPPTGGDEYTMGMHYTADLGVDSDYKYFQSYGNKSKVKNRIELVINTMDVQYERDVDITHRITKIIVRQSQGPYTQTDPSALLNQFRSEWNANQSAVKRDVAHLFTGKNLDGSVIGVAWLGVICNKSQGYGLVQSDCCGSLSCSADLSAHELGHNWNAGHCSCGGYTMNSSLTCANRFHPNSTIPSMKSYRNSRGCLDDPLPGDVLFEDDFESGSMKSGWNCSTASRCKIQKLSSYNSAWGLALKKTVTLDRSVSTVGYSGVTIIVAERSQNYESTEFLTLEWFDGSSWSTADQWQQKGWSERFTGLPAAAGNNANFAVRFSTNAKGKQERSKIDNFAVVGS